MRARVAVAALIGLCACGGGDGGGADAGGASHVDADAGSRPDADADSGATSQADAGGVGVLSPVGRFESLAEDAARIFSGLGVALKPLPEVGRFTRRDYREFYDEATRQKVAAHWARDLELFGYDFDGLTGAGEPRRAASD